MEGESAASLVRTILRRMLSNALASKYVLRQESVDDKETFQKLNLFKLLRGEVFFYFYKKNFYQQSINKFVVLNNEYISVLYSEIYILFSL